MVLSYKFFMNKKSLRIGGGILVAVVLFAIIFYLQRREGDENVFEEQGTVRQKEKTIEEVLSDLTPPTSEIPAVPQEVLKTLTPPAPTPSILPPVPKDVLKSLTPP